MTKHLTLLLFIGLAWGQSLKEMVEFNKCSKIEDELERLECYAKLVDINNPDSTEILLLKNFDRITKENYSDESEYKIVENSEIALMAISKVSAEENPILNYVFIIKDKSLAFNANLRSINDNYNEIFTKNKILKCIGNNDQKN